MRQRPELPDGLKWKKLSLFRRSYELRKGEQRYGSLEWGNPFGTQARGEILGSAWSFRRTGILKMVVTLQLSGASTPAGIFRYRWSGEGKLELENGRRYQWKRLKFWSGEWAFMSEEALVVRLRPEGVLRCSATVELSRDKPHGRDIPLLVLLG